MAQVPDFPGNSHTSKILQDKTASEEPEGAASPKKVEKVVVGKVTPRKKPLGVRFKEMFVGDDGESFSEYLITEVVVPTIKEMALNVIAQTAEGFRQGLEQRMFGSSAERPRQTIRTSGLITKPTVNYRAMSNPSTNRAHVRPVTPAIRRSNDVKDIIVKTRDDGDLVLAELDGMIEHIGHCTVGDFYNLVGERSLSTDEEWGWVDLSAARVHIVSGEGYLITMPRPRPIQSR